jgi:integrase
VSIKGNTHVRIALGTRDLDEANRRKWAVVASIKRDLAQLSGGDPTLHAAHRFRKEIRKAHAVGDEDYIDVVKDSAQEYAEKIERESGSLERARIWYAHATTPDKTCDELLEEWLRDAPYTEQTKKQHRHAWSQAKRFLGGDTIPAAVDERAAVALVEHLNRGQQAYETNRRKINSLSAFWVWLERKFIVPRGGNPWKGHRVTGTAGRDKRAYTKDELATLLGGTLEAPLADVVVLGLFTGARLDELCALTVGNLQKDKGAVWVSVTKSKSKAGIRTFAVIHPIPLEILRRRLAPQTSAGAQLFPELAPGGYDGKLSWSASKKFGRYKTGRGFDGSVDFHSFRRTLITQLENTKGIDWIKMARYVGHRVPTLAHSTYSGGSNRQTALEVARAIKYPKSVESAALAFLKRATPPRVTSPRGHGTRGSREIGHM